MFPADPRMCNNSHRSSISNHGFSALYKNLAEKNAIFSKVMYLCQSAADKIENVISFLLRIYAQNFRLKKQTQNCSKMTSSRVVG